MTDLLRPEVAIALKTATTFAPTSCAIIRAELERQAAEIAELRDERDQYRATNERVSVCRDHIGGILDGPCVICERNELRAKLYNPGTTHIEGCWTWGPKHYGCAENRIKDLEAELAAMRAMLEGAPTAFVSNKHSNGVPDSICPTGELPADWWGKRVRLVVEVE